MDFFERMRKMSRDTKDRYAFIAAFVVTGVIAAVWIIAIPAKIEKESIERAPEQVEEGGGFGELFTLMGSQIGSTIDAFRSDETTGTSETVPPSLEVNIDGENIATTTESENASGQAATEGLVSSSTTPLPRTVLIGTSSSQTGGQ
jgi:hypothetical protein